MKERVHKNGKAEILYERITVLEKQIQCLKNKIKNQQAVLEILVTNVECAGEWKTVKTKFKNNTNKVFACQVLSKSP